MREFNKAKLKHDAFRFKKGDIIDVKLENGLYKFLDIEGRWDGWSKDKDNGTFFTYFEPIYDKLIKDDYSHLVRLLKNL